MASLKLDDSEKKPKDLLDLTNVPINSEAELRKWLEKIPDLKIRLEKVYNDEIDGEKEDDNENSKSKYVEYLFLDPVSPNMKDVDLKELGRVNISWRMLTMSRPKTKGEEDFFSRLVQLEKLQYRTLQWEMEKELLSKRDGRSSAMSSHYKLIGNGARQRSQKGGLNRAAVTETRLQTCNECGEELCSGRCKTFKYEDHARTFNPVSMDIFDISKQSTSVKMARKPANEIAQSQQPTNDATAVVAQDSDQPSASDKGKQEPEKTTEKPLAKSKQKNKQKRSKKSIKRKKSSTAK
ncbi:hypothetical protein CHUAL_012671 [Chamberlinius hualienensis]